MTDHLEPGDEDDLSVHFSEENDEDDTLHNTNSIPQEPSLPAPLCILFGLNGVALALPTTAFMYIVNTRAAVPVAYLSAYGAISFLPWSLKPLYAYVTQRYFAHCGNCLLVTLFITSGIVTIATAWIPPNGVSWCFLLGFVRGIAGAFPEFLLGLLLLQRARDDYYPSNKFKVAAGLLQSQAATARNFGSLVANSLGFLVFAQRHYYNTENQEELSLKMVVLLFVAAGLVNFGAAGIALCHRVGTELNSTPTPPIISNEEHEGLHSPCDAHVTMSHSATTTTSFRGNCLLIVIFQLTIVIFALRQPIASLLTNLVWTCLMLVLGLTLGMLLYLNSSCKNPMHRVGIFLILRHALPSSTWLVSSFVYSRLQSTPVMLQALSMTSGGVTTLSSWSYGKVLARFSHGWYFLAVLVGTTVASSLASLGNLVMLRIDSNDDVWFFFTTVAVIQVVTGFCAEWQFLPDVVLATTAAVDTNESSTVTPLSLTELVETGSKEPSYQQVHPQPASSAASSGDKGTMDTTGMQYGSLVGCIDFGDQVGAFLTVPLVTALGVSRDNDWAHLDLMIILSAALGLISVLLIGIIRDY